MVFVLSLLLHHSVVLLRLFHLLCCADLKKICFSLYNGHWIVYCNGIINYVATRLLSSCVLLSLSATDQKYTLRVALKCFSHLWGECSTPFIVNAESIQKCTRTTMLQIKIENKFISYFVCRFDGILTYSLLLALRLCNNQYTMNTMYSFVPAQCIL